jgi:hypothetical protein
LGAIGPFRPITALGDQSLPPVTRLIISARCGGANTDPAQDREIGEIGSVCGGRRPEHHRRQQKFTIVISRTAVFMCPHKTDRSARRSPTQPRHPASIAWIAANLMLAGVSKSGSPAPRPMTLRPAAFSARAAHRSRCPRRNASIAYSAFPSRRRTMIGDSISHSTMPAAWAETEQRHLRAAHPGRRELRPDQQDREGGQPVDNQVQQLARRGVVPADILEHHQHGLVGG